MTIRRILFMVAVIATVVTTTCGGSSSPTAPTATTSSTRTVTSLSVSSSATSLEVGQTTTVTATAAYNDGTSATVAATWSSSNTGVATVSTSGTVTAVAAGTATITGTAGGQSGSIVITVAAATSAWRGIVIADENRCSPYDSGDYSYPQSVEDDIIDRLGGIYSPYTGECFASKSETNIKNRSGQAANEDLFDFRIVCCRVVPQSTCSSR